MRKSHRILTVTRHQQDKEINNGSNNKRFIKNNRSVALERTVAYATKGLIAFYWHQIFALDSVVAERKNCLARMEVS